MRTEIYSCAVSLLAQDSVLVNWWNISVNLVFKKAKLSGMSWLLRGLNYKFAQRYEKLGFVTSVALYFSEVTLFYSPLSLHYLGGYSSFWRKGKAIKNKNRFWNGKVVLNALLYGLLCTSVIGCFLFFFSSSNIDLSSKLNGNKFVPNLLVQQCFVTFFFKIHKHLSQKPRWVMTWANPPMLLLALFLVFSLSRFISSPAANWDLKFCAAPTLWLCVRSAQHNGTPYLPRAGAFSCCYTLSVCKQWPFRTCRVMQGFSFGVTSTPNVLFWAFSLTQLMFGGSKCDYFQPSVRSLNFTKLKLPVWSLLSVCQSND